MVRLKALTSNLRELLIQTDNEDGGRAPEDGVRALQNENINLDSDLVVDTTENDD